MNIKKLMLGVASVLAIFSVGSTSFAMKSDMMMKSLKSGWYLKPSLGYQIWNIKGDSKDLSANGVAWSLRVGKHTPYGVFSYAHTQAANMNLNTPGAAFFQYGSSPTFQYKEVTYSHKKMKLGKFYFHVGAIMNAKINYADGANFINLKDGKGYKVGFTMSGKKYGKMKHMKKKKRMKMGKKYRHGCKLGLEYSMIDWKDDDRKAKVLSFVISKPISL